MSKVSWLLKLIDDKVLITNKLKDNARVAFATEKVVRWKMENGSLFFDCQYLSLFLVKSSNKGQHIMWIPKPWLLISPRIDSDIDSQTKGFHFWMYNFFLHAGVCRGYFEDI